MTETAATPAAAPSVPGTIIEILEAAGAELPEASSTEPSGTPAPAARPAPAGFIDPLDDAAFADEKLATPEGVRAARALLQEQLKEAKKIRAAAHNARAEAERRSNKLAERGRLLEADKQLISTQKQDFAKSVADIKSGDPDRFIQAIGRLSDAKDPHDFWMRAATSLAKGKPVDEVRDAVTEELKREIEAMKAERAAEREQAQVSSHDQQIWNLRVAQVNEARTFTDLPYVHSLSNSEQVQLIDARLVDIKEKHFAQTGTPIDTRTACGILEKEIQSHFELLQQAGTRSAVLNGERRAAVPVTGQARPPERQIAKPEPAPTPAQIRSVSAVPAALSADPASNKRARTKAEKDSAIAAGLEELGVFANFGYR